MNINNLTNANAQFQMAQMNRDQMGTATGNGNDFASIMETAVTAMNEAQEAGEVRDTSQIRRAAVEMESFFINQMFQALRNTVPEREGIFARSNAEKIFQDMLDEETANNLAQSGGIGIADIIYADMTRNLG